MAMFWRWRPSTFSKVYISKIKFHVKHHRVEGKTVRFFFFFFFADGMELLLAWQHIAPIDLNWEQLLI